MPTFDGIQVKADFAFNIFVLWRSENIPITFSINARNPLPFHYTDYVFVSAILRLSVDLSL